MNKTLIFFCLACALLFLSIVTICIAPIINGLIGRGDDDWGNENCQIYADTKDKTDGLTDKEKDLLDRGKNLCNRQKAMYGLEYASFISDLILGFICALLSLLHFFGVGNSFEKFTGIIGLICGIIGFILTLIYIIYSGYIFTHDGGISYSYSGLSYSGSFYKLDKDRKFAEWDDSKSQYKCLYYDKDDIPALYAKYQDMGKKQYNYHKDYYFSESDSEYRNCKIGQSFTDSNGSPLNFNLESNDIISFCQDSSQNSIKIKGNGKTCENLYYEEIDDFGNKYKYDRWVTTIIFGCFIIALNLGLAIFGFLLFNQAGGSSGFVSAQ